MKTVDITLDLSRRKFTQTTIDAMCEVVLSTRRSELAKLFGDTLLARARQRGTPVLTAAYVIYGFLKENMGFKSDPKRVELLRHPDMHLQNILDHKRIVGTKVYTQGDCDENAMLGAALALRMGHRPALVVMKKKPEYPWHHVFWAIRTGPSMKREHLLPVDAQESREPGVWPDATVAAYPVEDVL